MIINKSLKDEKIETIEKNERELQRLLDYFQIKALFYTERCREDGLYHLVRNDDEKGYFEDEIRSEEWGGLNEKEM